MKYSILIKGNEYRGDHSSDTQIALEVRAGETVENLIDRAGIHEHTQVVELRLIWDGKQTTNDRR